MDFVSIFFKVLPKRQWLVQWKCQADYHLSNRQQTLKSELGFRGWNQANSFYLWIMKTASWTAKKMSKRVRDKLWMYVCVLQALAPECCTCHWNSCGSEVHRGEVPQRRHQCRWSCSGSNWLRPHGDSWPGDYQVVEGRLICQVDFVFVCFYDDLEMKKPQQSFLFITPQSMISHHKIQANAVLREVVMLGFGTMVNKYCAEMPACPADLVKVCVFCSICELR